MSDGKKTLIYYGCAEPTHNSGCVTDAINDQLIECLGGNHHEIESIDVIKIPGPDRFSNGFNDTGRGFIQQFINELRGAHNVVAIAVVGHEGCAGHPVSNDQHKEDVLQSAELLSKLNTGVSIFGFFAHCVDSDECHLDFLGCKRLEEAQVA